MKKSDSLLKEGEAGPLHEPGAEYNQIKEYEHHFNNLETEIRKFASAWLLAALGAIALLVRGDITNALLAPKSSSLLSVSWAISASWFSGFSISSFITGC